MRLASVLFCIPTMIFALDYGLGLASILFIAAYILGKKKVQPLHQYLAGLATLLTVGIGLALIILVRVVNAGDLGATGIKVVDGIDNIYVIVHRICASISFVLMLVQAYWGFARKIKHHKKTALPFLILYLLVYISGLILFTAK